MKNTLIEKHKIQDRWLPIETAEKGNWPFDGQKNPQFWLIRTQSDAHYIGFWHAKLKSWAVSISYDDADGTLLSIVGRITNATQYRPIPEFIPGRDMN
jgi:hypothetical protein